MGQEFPNLYQKLHDRPVGLALRTQNLEIHVLFPKIYIECSRDFHHLREPQCFCLFKGPIFSAFQVNTDICGTLVVQFMQV